MPIRRRHRRQRRPGAGRRVSAGHSVGGVADGTTRRHDLSAGRRRFQGAGRRCAAHAAPCRSTVVDERPGGRTRSILVIVDARDDARRAGEADRARCARLVRHGRHLRPSRREPNPDLILQSMRAGANEFFAWPPSEEAFDEALRRTAARRASSGAGQPADDDGVLRRQGRRRHDHARRELRRRDRAASKKRDADRRPQAGPRRGLAVPGRAQPLHAARRARQPAPARRASSCRSWWSSTSPGSRSWPAPISSIGPDAADSAGLEEVFRLPARKTTTTSSSTPARR